MTSPTTVKGNIGQAAVVFEALKKGYYVSVSNEGAVYDLIIDKHDGSLYRVQVKYASLKRGVIVIRFDCQSGTKGKGTQKYTPDNVDALVAYEPEGGQIYWIGSKFFRTHRLAVMSLRVDESKNNQTKNVNWAKDFLEW